MVIFETDGFPNSLEDKPNVRFGPPWGIEGQRFSWRKPEGGLIGADPWRVTASYRSDRGMAIEMRGLVICLFHLLGWENNDVIQISVHLHVLHQWVDCRGGLAASYYLTRFEADTVDVFRPSKLPTDDNCCGVIVGGEIDVIRSDHNTQSSAGKRASSSE